MPHTTCTTCRTVYDSGLEETVGACPACPEAAAIHLVPGDIVEADAGWGSLAGARVRPAHILSPGAVYPTTVTATVVEVGTTAVWLADFSGPCDGTRSGQDALARSRVIRVVRRAGEEGSPAPSPLNAARAAFRAYRLARDADAMAALDPATGLPNVLIPPSPEVERLCKLAGHYAMGWWAASDALIAVAESGSYTVVGLPTKAHEALYWAGWADRMVAEVRS